MQNADLHPSIATLKDKRTVYILGVRVDLGLTAAKVAQYLLDYVKNSNEKAIVCTTNPEFIMSAQDDTEFKEIINTSLLSVPDGIGVIFADNYLSYSRGLRVGLLGSNRLTLSVASFVGGLFLSVRNAFASEMSSKRITGVGLVRTLCELGGRADTSFFFLGGGFVNGEPISGIAASNAEKQYPGIHVLGFSSRYSFEPQDDAETVAYINNCISDSGKSFVDFLLVGYGHSNQEKWIQRNISKLNVKVCMGVGGTLDYMSHVRKDTPNVYKSANLDWLYRLVTQQWRIRRIINAFPIFPLKVFLDSLKTTK